MKSLDWKKHSKFRGEKIIDNMKEKENLKVARNTSRLFTKV